MRSRGKSLPEIVQRLHRAKTTVWHHIKDVELSDDARQALRAQGGTIKGARVWRRAQKFASHALKKIDVAESWPILIAALYWCEGTKRSGFVFTNTDPNMVRVFLKILRENMSASNSDLDVLVRTCKPMNPITCRRYWSDVTGIPFRRIRINHHDIHNRSKTKYGMCRITLKKGTYHLKTMHCLIAEMIDKMIPSGVAPVAQWIELRSPNAAM